MCCSSALSFEISETPSQPRRVSRAHLALATEDETLCVVIATCWVEGRLRCYEAFSSRCKHVALQLRRSELVHGERVNHDIGSKASGAQLTAASGDRTDEALLSDVLPLRPATSSKRKAELSHNVGSALIYHGFLPQPPALRQGFGRRAVSLANSHPQYKASSSHLEALLE